MSTDTITTTKRTTKRTPKADGAVPVAASVLAAAAASDPLVREADESDRDYVARVAPLATVEAAAAVAAVILTRDDASRVWTFGDRIDRSFMAGHAAMGEATRRSGTAPKSFDDVASALGITAKGGGKFLDRSYSTLRECYDIATFDTPVRREAFTVDHREATKDDEHPDGIASESMRDYVAYARAKAKGGATAAKANAKAIAAKRDTAAKNAAKAVTDAAEAAARTATLVAAGAVSGCSLTAKQWADMPEQVLRDVAALATALATAKGAQRREAERAAAKAKAASETGPAPAVRSRRTVAA